MTTVQTALPNTFPAKSLESALSVRTRPQRPNALNASLIYAWRALLKIRHVPMQLFDVTAFPIMSTLLFTYLFGGALAGSTDAYLQFLLPGILAQTVVMITMYTALGLNTDITKGIFDRFRSLPLWGPAVLVGALLADTVRYALAAMVVLVLGLIMGFDPNGGVLGIMGALLVILIFSFSLSWVWTVLALLMPTPETVMGVSMMILFPLTFISNIFVDPDTMPRLLKAFVGINPISHLATAVRGLMHGTSTFEDIVLVLISSVVLVAVFSPLTMYLYRNKNAH
jgi:ABC-2 type transport system permease protein